MSVPRSALTEGRCEANGLTIHYYECGVGEALLFLHGGGLSALSFQQNILSLGRRYHVVAPDIPGFGKSSVPPWGWDFRDVAGLLARFVEVMGLDVRVLVGYSFGGGIALDLAPQLPSLEELLLLSPAAGGIGYRHAGFLLRVVAEAASGLVYSIGKGKTRVFMRIVWEFTENMGRKAVHQYWVLRYVMRSLQRRWGVAPIAVPTTVVSAGRDWFFPPATGEALARDIGKARWMEAEGMHLWVLLDHEKFDKLVCNLGGGRS